MGRRERERKQRAAAAAAAGEPPRTPRVLPRVDPDVVHILAGRRVISVHLPERGPPGSEVNYRRAAIVSTELARLRRRPTMPPEG